LGSCVSCDPMQRASALNVAYIDAQVNDIRSSAASIGREIVILNASTIAEIDAAFATLRQMRTDVLSVAVDPFFFDRASQIVVLAARHAMHGTEPCGHSMI
jgi:hypothetical protein